MEIEKAELPIRAESLVHRDRKSGQTIFSNGHTALKTRMSVKDAAKFLEFRDESFCG